MFYNSAILLGVAALAHASVLSPRGSPSECQAQADACRTKPEANQAVCSAQLASCLGYNPYSNNTSTAATPSPSTVYTTEVVTSFTTFCPSPTTLVHGSKTYTVTKATTLTITDCPCTITKASTSAPPAATSTSCGDAARIACIQAATNNGKTPNLADCAASSASAQSTCSATATGKSNTTEASKPTAHPTTITEVVSSYTTYCPEATTVVHGSKTYTAKASETLTITDCPCTLTKTSTSASATSTSCGDAARVACIQAAVNKGQSPNFADCAASSASAQSSCSATATGTALAPPAAMTTSCGEAARVACIQAAVNKGDSPNFADCAASSASAAASCTTTSGPLKPTVSAGKPLEFTTTATQASASVGTPLVFISSTTSAPVQATASAGTPLEFTSAGSIQKPVGAFLAIAVGVLALL